MTTYLDAIDSEGLIAGTSAYDDVFFAEHSTAIEAAFKARGFDAQPNANPYSDAIDTNAMKSMAEVDNYLVTLFPV